MTIRLTAGIIIKDKKVLLVHNAKHSPARLEPPGGKIKTGESPEEALLREVREELGVEVRPIRFIGTFKTTSPEGAFDVETYLCEIVSGAPTLAEPHIIIDFTWVGFDDLLSLKSTGTVAPNVVEGLELLKGLL